MAYDRRCVYRRGDACPEGRACAVAISTRPAGTFRSGVGFSATGAIVTRLELCCQPVVFEAKLMTQDLIFAQDVILDPDTATIVAVVRNGAVWRDGAKVAVLVGAQMYDLNGNLLGKLAMGEGRCRFRSRT
jgi:hypothetical protein